MAPKSVIAEQQVAVPETLLKKRRVNEKTREEKLAKAAEAKKVSHCFIVNFRRSKIGGREARGGFAS
jgi:hypothetical protein